MSNQFGILLAGTRLVMVVPCTGATHTFIIEHIIPTSCPRASMDAFGIIYETLGPSSDETERRMTETIVNCYAKMWERQQKWEDKYGGEDQDI